jgi:hypothetical protein
MQTFQKRSKVAFSSGKSHLAAWRWSTSNPKILEPRRKCSSLDCVSDHDFELASLNATNLVMRKEDMLVPVETLAVAK